MTESLPESGPLKPKAEAYFRVACEYRLADDQNGNVVTRFGADLRGDPHVQRTVWLGTDEEASVTMRTYALSETALLTGLTWHLAAGRDESARAELHRQILEYRSQLTNFDTLDEPQPVADRHVAARQLRTHLAGPPPEAGQILSEVSLYGGQQDSLCLVEATGGVAFRERHPKYDETIPEGLSEAELDDYEPPIKGYFETDLFTVPDRELISFIAALSKSDRGRIRPADLLATLNGLLPAAPGYTG